LFYNSILLAEGQNERNNFLKGIIGKVLKWCCGVCLGSKYKFYFKNQKYGKGNCRNSEGSNLSCWCCCKPWFSDLCSIKEHHEAIRPVKV